MRSVFEEEEEEVEGRESHASYGDTRADDREVTISSTTLLMIFFGLVLICALFFGLGYTLGRRSPSETNTLQKSDAATLPASLPSNAGSKPSAAPQPSPAQPQAVNETPAPEASSDPTEDSATPEPAYPKTVAPKPAITPSPEAASTPAPRQGKAALPASVPTPNLTPAPEPAAPIAGTTPGTMVQIAAISNPADADVLVRALQKRGYSVTVRHATTDTLLHVQIGPYPIRADAIAMRQKLLGDGYNAILK